MVVVRVGNAQSAKRLGQADVAAHVRMSRVYGSDGSERILLGEINGRQSRDWGRA